MDSRITQSSFEQLKNLLTTIHVLRIIDVEKEFFVCIDAYQEGLGGVLMQEGLAVAYESWKLKEWKNIYSAYYLDLTTIINALKVWRHYLLGKKFILMTEHNSLTSFFKQLNLMLSKHGGLPS